MMKHCLILAFLFVTGAFGFSQSKESRVISFNYGGFSDTTVALLTITSNIDELGLRILQNETLFLETKTSPKRPIGFSYGHWDLLLYKTGYDTILIKDYYAVSDQVSNVQLFLTKGNKKIIYTTKPPSYLFPKNGTDSTFFESGKLNRIRTYRNDSLIYQIEYFETGSLKYKDELLDNGLTSSIKYYENGQLEFISFWNKGITEGYRKEYFKNGKLKEHLLNTNEGQLSWYSADSTGVITIEKGNTLMDYRIQRGIDTTINVYKNGLKEGRWIYYYSNGNVLWIEEYKNGKKVLFEHYSQDGTLYKREEY